MTIQPNHKLAWITGAGTGIGRAMAIKLAQQGWIVAISARTLVHLEETAKQMPGKIYAFPLDVTDNDAVMQVCTAIEDQLGAIDMVMLNAGIYKRDSVKTFNSADFDATIDVNLKGTAHCLSAIMPRMLERQKGRILVVASVAGYSGLPGAAAYGASKAALINMCEALYPELLKNNICLSVVNPGFVDTPLTKKNDFPMPFLITEEQAANHMMRGLQSSRFEIAFPWKMVFISKLLSRLPDSLRFAITRKMLR